MRKFSGTAANKEKWLKVFAQFSCLLLIPISSQYENSVLATSELDHSFPKESENTLEISMPSVRPTHVSQIFPKHKIIGMLN